MSANDTMLAAARRSLRTDWRYGIATIVVLLLGLFLSWIEGAFARSWFPAPYISWPARITGAMTLLLVISPTVYFMRPRFTLFVNAAVSGLMAIMVFCFLRSILDIARGNNDSGDVFWIVVLPGIVCAAYSYVSYLKVKKLQS